MLLLERITNSHGGPVAVANTADVREMSQTGPEAMSSTHRHWCLWIDRGRHPDQPYRTVGLSWSRKGLAMSALGWIALAGLAMSALTLVGSATLLMPERLFSRVVTPLVAVAAGALLGVRCFTCCPNRSRWSATICRSMCGSLPERSLFMSSSSSCTGITAIARSASIAPWDT